MIPFKKIQFYALTILSIIVLILGIKNVIFPNFETLELDLKIICTSLIVFAFNFGININLYVRNRCSNNFMWIFAIFFAIVSCIMWIIPIWFDLEQEFIKNYIQLAISATVLSITATNFTCVNLIESRNVYTPIVLYFTKIFCIILAILSLMFIYQVFDEKTLLFRSLIIIFMLLCFCNCNLTIIHFTHKKKKENNELNLVKTSIENIYCDKLGNLYKVTSVKEVSNEELSKD